MFPSRTKAKYFLLKALLFLLLRRKEVYTTFFFLFSFCRYRLDFEEKRETKTHKEKKKNTIFSPERAKTRFTFLIPSIVKARAKPQAWIVHLNSFVITFFG